MRAFTTMTLLAAALAGCPRQQQRPPPDEEERRSFTANLADGIVVPRLVGIATKASALREAVDALAAANGVDGPQRDAARAAWRAAMDVWQELDVMHLGPAGGPQTPTGGFTGGQGLRDRIYAWPVALTNTCAIDSFILADSFGQDGWIDDRLTSQIGLGALEYVLFAGDDNGCPSTESMNTQGTWTALGTPEVKKRRARYGAVLAADVESRVAALHDAWTAEGGFATTLRTAGAEGSAFPTAQQALDETYAALFIVEVVTKDKKLGLPAGLFAGCEAEACPEKAESRFSRTSKENIARNLVAARLVFTGGGQTGFDDLLIEKDQEQLAIDMTAALDGAIAAVEGFDGTLDDALTTEPARVRALYEQVKVFTDDFKSTFASVLGLRVPQEFAGDND